MRKLTFVSLVLLAMAAAVIPARGAASGVPMRERSSSLLRSNPAGRARSHLDQGQRPHRRQSLLRESDFHDPAPDSWNCRLLGRLEYQGLDFDASTGAVLGNYWYVGGRGSPWLVVFDRSDPDDIRPVGKLNTGMGDVCKIVPLGDYLLLTGGPPDRVLVLDVQDPRAPRIVESRATSHDRPWDVEVQGDFAYVASWDGLTVLDVSNPLRLREIAFLGLDGLWQIAVSGNTVTGILDMWSLVTVDVTIPAGPRQCAELELRPEYELCDLAAQDRFVYVAAGEQIFVVDVGDPLVPVVVATLAMEETWPFAVEVSGKRAFFAGDGLAIYGISNPERPVLLAQVRSVDANEYGSGIVVRGDTAFLAEYRYLHIVDCSRPGPLLIGAAELPDCGGLFVRDDLVYAATAENLSIVRIADSTAPNVLGSAPARSSRSVAVRDSLACVTSSSGYLRVFDITEPGLPVQVGELRVYGSPGRVVMRETLAYVAAGDRGFKIVSLSDPAVPVQVGGISIGPKCLDLALRDSLAFLACDAGGLAVVNIRDPAHPVPVCTLGGLYCTAVGLAGDMLYVSGYNWPRQRGELRAVSAADPARLRVLDSLPVSFGTLFVRDTLVFGTSGDGVEIVNAADPTALRIVGHIPSDAAEVWLRGRTAFVAGRDLTVFDVPDSAGGVISHHGRYGGEPENDLHEFRPVGDFGGMISDSGLQVVAIAEPAQARGVGTYRLGGARHVCMSGANALVTTDDSLVVVSIADPEHPTRRAALRGRFSDVEMRDNLVFLGDNTRNGSRGLRILDLSDASRPESIGFCLFPGRRDSVRTEHVATAGNRVYVTGRNGNAGGVFVVDVTDPALPALVGFRAVGSEPSGIAVRDSLVFVVSGQQGLTVLNAAGTGLGVKLGQYLGGGGLAGGIALTGKLACLLDREQGLVVLDVSEPSRPIACGLYRLSSADAVAVSGDRVYVCGGTALSIVQVEAPGAPRDPELPRLVQELRTSADPWIAQTWIRYTVPVAGMVRLRLFDATGRLARVLVSEDQPAGEHACRLESLGLPHGAYLVRLETQAGTNSLKTVCVR